MFTEIVMVSGYFIIVGTLREHWLWHEFIRLPENGKTSQTRLRCTCVPHKPGRTGYDGGNSSVVDWSRPPEGIKEFLENLQMV